MQSAILSAVVHRSQGSFGAVLDLGYLRIPVHDIALADQGLGYLSYFCSLSGSGPTVTAAKTSPIWHHAGMVIKRLHGGLARQRRSQRLKTFDKHKDSRQEAASSPFRIAGPRVRGRDPGPDL
ncbi:hypothetical protein SKAU_G00175290 [Synaphobranchus kaupii]|uniref:Uncharacterized protein n=1 Tax=Synaphobranchus kaupii TaxID=118154 RepID=A0A9Q1IYZ9_SYNKA|nr:hypothetical protein SKAU_G00175290 [Synaphobranchus kaupii]